MDKIIKIIIIIMIGLFITFGILIYQKFTSPTNTEHFTTTTTEQFIDAEEEIYQAIINKNTDVYRNYIDNSENLNIILKDGKTILEHLVVLNDVEYVEKIINNGFSLKEVETNHIDVIRNIMASYPPENPIYNNKVTQLIMQIKDELYETDSNGYSLLMNAIYLRNEEIAKKIIELIDDVNKVYNNEIALSYACKIGFNNLEVIEALIAKNANVNFQGENGYTCLMYLVEYELENILSYMVNLKDIDLNLVNSDKQTVLHICVEINGINIIDTLLEKADNIDFTIKDKNGLTAKELALIYSEKYPQEDFNENGINDYLELVNKLENMINIS